MVGSFITVVAITVVSALVVALAAALSAVVLFAVVGTVIMVAFAMSIVPLVVSKFGMLVLVRASHLLHDLSH